MSFFNKFSKFHKIYFIFYVTVNILIFLVPFFEKGISKETISIIGVLALISTITGLLSSLYTARGEVICYVWGFINTFTYIFVAWATQAYGQSILYIFFETPMQVVGYYLWKKNIEQSSSNVVEARRLNKKEWVFLIVSFIVVWVVYAIFLKALPHLMKSLLDITISPDRDFIIDSLSSTLTICAVILTTKRFFEQWHFWIASTAIGMLLFLVSMVTSKDFSLNSLSAFVMWSQFLINSIYGFSCWKKFNTGSEKAA